jgi:hypothetical protein
MNTQSDQLGEPIPISLDLGTEKVPGFIMKLNITGMLVEVEKIPFKVGSYLTATFELLDDAPVIERMRSIKHYDRFFRKQLKKKPAEGEPAPLPKKLVELHFHMIKEGSKVAITKYLLAAKQAALSAYRR